jgi:hypothetical protein
MCCVHLWCINFTFAMGSTALMAIYRRMKPATVGLALNLKLLLTIIDIIIV